LPNELDVQTPTLAHTAPLARITPGVNGVPAHAPNRELNDSVRMLATFPSSFWINELGVKVTPPVSWRRAGVYQPCRMEALHPVLLNGTGFSPNVTTKEELGVGGRVGLGPEVVFVLHAANKITVAVAGRRPAAVLRSTFHASHMG